MMYDNTEKLPRAILVAVDTGEYDAETSLLELEELARTAGVEVAATSIQKRPAPIPPRWWARDGSGNSPRIWNGWRRICSSLTANSPAARPGTSAMSPAWRWWTAPC